MPAVTIDIEARFAKFQDGLDQIFRQTKSTAEKMHGVFEGVNKALGLIGVGLGAAELVKFFKEATEEAKKFEQSMVRINVVVRNVGDAAKVSVKDVDELAEALSKSTQFDHTSLRDAAAQILVFGKIHGDTFKQALQVSSDLASFMGTNVVDAARQVASAMADPERAVRLLRTAGVVLTEQQVEQLKHMVAIGDQAGAQVLILGRLQAAFKGVAAEMNTGITKSTTGLSKAWSDMLEEFGKTTFSENVFGVFTKGLHAAAELLKDFQRQTATIGSANGPSTGKIRRSGDPVAALQKQIEEQQAKLAGAAGGDPGEEARARIDTLVRKGLPGIQLQANKDELAEIQKLLDSSHAEALISDKQFFKERQAIIERSLEAELNAVNSGLAAQEEIITRTGTTPEAIAAAELEQVKLFNQRTKAEEAASAARTILARESLKNEREFNKELANTNAELLELQGRTAQAAAVRFDTNTADQTRRLKAEAQSPDEGRASAARASLQQLGAQRDLIVSQAKLNELESVAVRIRTEATDVEERANILAHSGALSQLEADRITSDARAQQLADLRRIYDAKKAIADLNPEDLRLQDQVKALELEMDKLSATVDVVHDKFQTIGKDAFSGLMESLRSGGGLRAALKAFQNIAVRSIDKIVNESLGDKLFGKQGIFGGAVSSIGELFGGAKKSPVEAAAGDPISKAIAALGASKAADTAAQTAAVAEFSTSVAATGTAFSAEVTAAGVAFSPEVIAAGTAFSAEVAAAGAAFAAAVEASAVASGGGSGASGLLSTLLGEAKGDAFVRGRVIPFARGGVVTSPTLFRMANGGMGVMGEAGEEAVLPLRRGRDGKLGVAASGGNGAGGDVFNITIQTPDFNSFRQSEGQIAAQMQRMLNRGKRNL